jgi:O-antigen/teichoic acid export membrane protein
MAVVAESLLTALYGSSYEPGNVPLRVLGWTVLLLASVPLTMFLVACRRDRAVLIATSAGAASCVLLNLLLIPRYDMLGAAVASLGSGVVGLLVLCWFVRPLLSRGLECTWLLRPLASSVAMGILVLIVPASLPIAILLGMAAYTVAAIITGTWDRTRLSEIRQHVATR